ncbi:membrane-associated s in eicosanoid and glutathione metabolism [Pyrrhoderma noxium]|uniref:Glutathione S-transferase 3, mitochondrial n=1 Tax=Pyrrhoderma noxium TaxID=2282107 RepID=A0A286UK22_9AGAM|nr:membrane-associated s in eicosanoid and glutathione metabolism [Pyrrhoderma noxium]
MSSIVFPKGFSYVVAVSTSTIFLNIWQYLRVNSARKFASVDYPQMYAEKSEAAADQKKHIFNCIQRTHQNTLEIIPYFLLSLFTTGIKHPYLASAFGATWVVGRVFYTIGYSSGDPIKRVTRGGFLSSIGISVLSLTAAYASYEILADEL